MHKTTNYLLGEKAVVPRVRSGRVENSRNYYLSLIVIHICSR